MTQPTQLAHSSLLPTLVSPDVATLIDHKDIEINVLGALQHSASEMITTSLSLPCPYPLQIQLIDSALILFGHAFPLAAMKHRAQVTGHFIDCLRQDLGSFSCQGDFFGIKKNFVLSFFRSQGAKKSFKRG